MPTTETKKISNEIPKEELMSGTIAIAENERTYDRPTTETNKILKASLTEELEKREGALKSVTIALAENERTRVSLSTRKAELGLVIGKLKKDIARCGSETLPECEPVLPWLDEPETEVVEDEFIDTSDVYDAGKILLAASRCAWLFREGLDVFVSKSDDKYLELLDISDGNGCLRSNRHNQDVYEAAIRLKYERLRYLAPKKLCNTEILYFLPIRSNPDIFAKYVNLLELKGCIHNPTFRRVHDKRSNLVLVSDFYTAILSSIPESKKPNAFLTRRQHEWYVDALTLTDTVAPSPSNLILLEALFKDKVEYLQLAEGLDPTQVQEYARHLMTIEIISRLQKTKLNS